MTIPVRRDTKSPFLSIVPSPDVCSSDFPIIAPGVTMLVIFFTLVFFGVHPKVNGSGYSNAVSPCS